jgi:hypothetical protein
VRTCDFAGRGLAPALEGIESGGGAGQAGALAADVRLELPDLLLQHRADLPRGQIFRDEASDLAKGKAQVLEGEDAVELLELGGLVVSVAGRALDARGPQQADVVVVAPSLDRDLRQPREATDPVHAHLLLGRA